MAKLSVHLIVYHDKEAKYIPYLFHTLGQQTFRDFELILIENGPTENVFNLVIEEAKKLGVPYKTIKNTENIGFAAGHNTGYKAAEAEYVVLQNPDMMLTPDAYKSMVEFMDANDDVAAASIRLMRLDFEKTKACKEAGGKSMQECIESGYTNQIDAIGIRLMKNRRAVEWLTRHEWEENSNSPDIRRLYGKKVREVFGVSGAFPMYRKPAIDKIILPDGNLFDPLYHSYKEDLDLAYRMRNAGYTSYVLLDTVAYHDRTGAGPKELSDVAAAKNKKSQSYYVQTHSYKNHMMTLYKNEYWQNFLLDFFPIMWYEAKKFGYYLILRPKVFFVAWGMILRHFAKLQSARKAVLASRKMHWKGIRRWFL